jgi:hypothetical protein
MAYFSQIVPYERREESSNAYCRIIKVSGGFHSCTTWVSTNVRYKNVGPERLGSLIRPADVNKLFECLGASKNALDPSKEVTPMSHYGKN